MTIRLTARLLDPLLDLVLPRRCVGCGERGVALCRGCCGAQAPFLVAHRDLPVVAATRYGGGVRAGIVRYKERGRRDLAGPLAALLAGAVRSVVGAAPVDARPVLVAVPSSRVAAAARGGDHVARLARRSAVRAGVPVVPGVLGYRRATRDSAGLGVAERAANLDRALAARAPAPGLAAVLVDDIVTTGATLGEAARALRAAGWPVLGAAVIAATPRRGGTRSETVTSGGGAAGRATHWRDTGNRSSVSET